MNLGKSNAAWNVFWDRFLAILALARWTRDNLQRVELTRELNHVVDPHGNLAGKLTLVGGKPRRNLTEDGRAIFRISGSGPYTVSVYRDEGGDSGDLVAQGAGAADSAITLAAQNGSGLSGSYPLAAAPTETDADEHYAHVFVDWRSYLDRVFDGTDPEGEDRKTLEGINDSLNAILSLYRAALNEVVTLLGKVMIADNANENPRAYGSRFLGEVFRSLLSEQAGESSGAITRIREGALEALRAAMVDETTGSTQTVARRLVSAAAAVAGTGNQGQGAITSHTPEGHCPTGVYHLRCVVGLGNGGGGREEFEVSYASDEDDRTKVHSMRLRIGQAYQGEDGFGPITMTRTLAKTGDGSNVNLAAVSSGWTIAGESELNTSAGVLRWRIVETATGVFSIFFYKSENLVPSELVAAAVGLAATGAFTALQREASGLTIGGALGSAPVDGATGTLNLNFHSVRNAGGRPDSYTIAVTLVAAGALSEILAALPLFQGNGYRLNGVEAGTELITDGRVKANTRVPYSGEA